MYEEDFVCLPSDAYLLLFLAYNYSSEHFPNLEIGPQSLFQCLWVDCLAYLNLEAVTALPRLGQRAI